MPSIEKTKLKERKNRSKRSANKYIVGAKATAPRLGKPSAKASKFCSVTLPPFPKSLPSGLIVVDILVNVLVDVVIEVVIEVCAGSGQVEVEIRFRFSCRQSSEDRFWI